MIWYQSRRDRTERKGRPRWWMFRRSDAAQPWSLKRGVEGPTQPQQIDPVPLSGNLGSHFRSAILQSVPCGLQGDYDPRRSGSDYRYFGIESGRTRQRTQILNRQCRSIVGRHS